MFSRRIDDHLELRLLEERHADELFALTDKHRAYLREWLPWLDATKKVRDTVEFIKGTLKQFAEDNGFSAGIWLDGALVGVIGLHGINRPNRWATIGYWLAEDAQGKGVMTRACRAVVDHLIGDIGLNRIGIACATENRKSRAIPERLGFKQEGIQRQVEWLYGKPLDHAVYSVLASEWGQDR